MKTIFIPAKSKSKANQKKILELSSQLPKNIAIAYSIQFKDISQEIKKILSKNHNITSITQVLGCSNPKFSKTTQAVLLISSGRFHAISLANESGLPIYILDRDKLTKISKKDIEDLKKQQKVAYLKFLNSKKTGILVSTKPGQNRLKQAITLKNKIKGKESYLFLSNNINTLEFENFPDIESWINTACPRLDMNNTSIINMNNIKP
jgi:2-(3-amino-3-carboxypropyl)histidine synthase